MATPREQLDQAQDFLMIPDYLHYRLTGRKANEYTEASTTGMLNSATRDWDQEVLAAAGIPTGIFHRPEMPGHQPGPHPAGDCPAGGLQLRCGASRHP